MPTCDPRLISPVLSEVLRMQPKSVLDIGVGTGKWGALIREYTDVWCQRTSSPFDASPHNRTIIDGIEIHPAYRNPLWGCYNRVTIGDACGILPSLRNSYDLVLCIEVLEHLDRASGAILVRQVLERCSAMILSYTNTDQGSAFGNEHERHISRWSEEELGGLFPQIRKLISIDGITEAFILKGSRQ